MLEFKKKGRTGRVNLKVILILTVSLILILIAGMWISQHQNPERESIPEGIRVFMPKNEVSALFYDGRYIWVGGRDGVCLLDPESGEVVREVKGDIGLSYTGGICQTPDGRVWIGHEKGIAVFEGELRTDFNSPELPEGRVNTVVGDGRDGVWAGIQGGAVHFVKKGNVYEIDRVLTSRDGLSEDAVNSIAIDSRKGIWFGAYLANKVGGLSILRDGSWQYFSVNQGLPHRYVTSILPVSEERMLVGTGHLDRGGLALFKESGEEYVLESLFSMDNGLPGEKIRQLFMDSRGHLWVTTESDGVLICKSPGILGSQDLEGVYLTTRNGLSNNEVKAVIETEEYYWLGCKLGLTRIEKSVIEELMAGL